MFSLIDATVPKSLFSSFFTVKITTSPRNIFLLRENGSERILRKRLREEARGRCFLLNENPRRRWGRAFGIILQTIDPKKRGFPLRNTLSKSSFVLSRKAFFSIATVFANESLPKKCFFRLNKKNYAVVSLFLPCRRRRIITACPPLVFILFKNPCRRECFRLFGWYVFFDILAQ